MKSEIERILENPEAARFLQQERLIVEVTELITRTMNAEGIRRSDLAKKLGRTRGRITQLLDGTENMTLRTLADVFTAMGKMLCLRANDIAIVEKPWAAVEIAPVQYNLTASRSKKHWITPAAEVPLKLDSEKIAA